MAYGYFPAITAANKVLRDKAINIANNSKYHGYQKQLPSMVYTFFDKCFLVVL